MVLAFSLPFSRRLPAFPVPLLNYQNLVLLAALIAYGTHREESGSRRGRAYHAILITGFSFFVTLSFIKTVTTFQPDRFWRFWDPYENMLNYKALITCLALYVLASKAVTSREDLIAVFKAGVAGIVVESAYTAFEYVVLRPGRVTGHMAEPNMVGSFLACSFAFCLALVLILPRTDIFWKLGAAAMVLAPVALLGTLSRGSYAAAALGFLVVTTLLDKRMLVVGVAIVALYPLWIPAKVSHRFSETLQNEESQSWKFRDGKAAEGSALIAMIDEKLDEGASSGELDSGETRLDSSVQTRLVVWEAAVKMMRDHPLGIGYGVFPWYMQYYSTIVKWKASHNIYLRVGAESGIAALGLFLILLALFLRGAFRIGTTRDDVLLKALGLGFFGYMITLGFNALSVDIFFQVDVNGQFWVFVGALLQAPLLPRAVADIPRVEEARATPQGATPLYELVR